ncbi:hypothetical protein [Microbispora bryophytorum]|uniref:hypothetical protein n=1 Tax=Microbispora bryophytorum TaxID=1460882 RepID=UPI0033FA918D
MATTTKKSRPKGRRNVSEAKQQQDKATKAEANAALRAYAALCLADPAELELLRSIAASIGWKYDPASSDPGYTLQNVALLAAQRRPLVHTGGFNYWLEQGRCVAAGEKALGTFRHVGRKQSEEDKKREEELAAEGWQSTKPRRPRYVVRRGTFDVTQTVPLTTCPNCGTAPAGPDDRTTKCPPTCAAFAFRPGPKPPRDLVVEVLQAQLDDEDEGDGDE